MNAELEPTKNQITLIKSQNETYLKFLTSDEFQKPLSNLQKSYEDKLNVEEQSVLVKKAYELAYQNWLLKEAIDKCDVIDSKVMIEQIKNSILKQNEMNELIKDVKRKYDESITEYEHLQDIERK